MPIAQTSWSLSSTQGISGILVLVVLGGIIDREKVLLIIGQVKTVVHEGVWNAMVMERFFMCQNVTHHISVTPDIEKMLI